MTRLKAESNYNNNWKKMIEQTQSMTDLAKEEKIASVKSTYASDMREACINLEAENKILNNLIESFMNEWEKCGRLPDSEQERVAIDNIYIKMYENLFIK